MGLEPLSAITCNHRDGFWRLTVLIKLTPSPSAHIKPIYDKNRSLHDLTDLMEHDELAVLELWMTLPSNRCSSDGSPAEVSKPPVEGEASRGTEGLRRNQPARIYRVAFKA